MDSDIDSVPKVPSPSQPSSDWVGTYAEIGALAMGVFSVGYGLLHLLAQGEFRRRVITPSLLYSDHWIGLLLIWLGYIIAAPRVQRAFKKISNKPTSAPQDLS
jgi:hypothetical protein